LAESGSQAAKLEHGNVRAAIRLIMSDATPVPLSPESLAKLNEKHPAASVQLSDQPTPSQASCFSVHESEFRRAVLSFPVFV